MKSNNNIVCRFCGNKLKYVFADLGATPVSNANIAPQDINKTEVYYPLKVFVCDKCFLVQLPEHESAENIFNDQYAYFSSYSTSWLEHAQGYVDYITDRLKLSNKSQVIEIASNDGYLLQYFLPKKIPVLGIEPARNTARVAIEKGIPTLTEFFGVKLAKKLVSKNMKADLFIGNNVLAHVPGLNDLVAGMKIILKPEGIITMEFPHLLRLIKGNQFDTIYHEHFSYFSFTTVRKIFARHTKNINLPETERAKELVKTEKEYGIEKVKSYTNFQNRIIQTKLNLLEFLVAEKKKGMTFVGYGAPAKGNTFLNYCGIRSDFLDYTVDRSPHKQNHFLHGTRIPIYSPDEIRKTNRYPC